MSIRDIRLVEANGDLVQRRTPKRTGSYTEIHKRELGGIASRRKDFRKL
jgi:hypothetical protein